jgi:predicted transcriptional regulator
VSEYPRTTVRLPRDVRALLKRTAKLEQRPEWRVLVDAIRAYATAAK